ncbi:MAG TPA: DUF1465 family protein [Geminicoccaceae bacterium]|nr:DUF1465 family protein [Geminicoccus sp.]HMU50619.1 DUF1465 family protein [Geminicoccaceae bacterium]
MAASTARLATVSGVAMLDGLLNETLRLAAEVRAYLAEGGRPVGCRGSTSLAPLVEARELGRLSARLGFCISWLLTRRAVQEGSPGGDQADSPSRLEGSEICLAAGACETGDLSDELRDMLDRSLALYRRVARLDRRLDA